MPPALRNNPGKTASPYNLPEHPYLKGQGDPNCPECRRQGLVPPGRRLSDDNHDGREDELCPLHQLAEEKSRQKEDYKHTLKELSSILQGREITLPGLPGVSAKIVRNSITENLRYGRLYPVKKEILYELDRYLELMTKPDYQENVKRDEKKNVLGYFVHNVRYLGVNPEASGRLVEIKFEKSRFGTIRLPLLRSWIKNKSSQRPVGYCSSSALAVLATPSCFVTANVRTYFETTK